jgi:hypothetical protein
VAGEPRGVDIGRGLFVSEVGFGFMHFGHAPNHEAPVANVGGAGIENWDARGREGFDIRGSRLGWVGLSELASDDFGLTGSGTRA